MSFVKGAPPSTTPPRKTRLRVGQALVLRIAFGAVKLDELEEVRAVLGLVDARGCGR